MNGNNFTIGKNAFSDNNITGSFTVNEVSIGESAFANNAITSLTIGDDVVSIGDEAFEDNNITSLTFEGTSTDGSGNDTSSLTTLGSSVFGLNLKSQISIYLPSSLTTTGGGIFAEGSDYNYDGADWKYLKIYVNKTSIPSTFNPANTNAYELRAAWNDWGGRDIADTYIISNGAYVLAN